MRARIALSIVISCSLIVVILAPFANPTQAQSDNPGTTGLSSCWDLDESSGVRDDGFGSNDLTDNNTVGSAGGVVSSAADFVSANGEQLTAASAGSLQFTSDFTVAAWVYVSSDPAGEAQIVGKGGEYSLGVTSSAIRWTIDSTVTGSDPSPSNWYFVVGRAEGATSSLIVDTTEYTGTVTGQSPTAQDFSIGLFMDGRVDQVILYQRALPIEEVAWLYNGGLGRSCQEVTSQATPTPTITPTPGAQRLIQLSSGDTAMIRRDVTYGDLMVTGMLGLFIVVILVGLIWLTVKGVVT